MWHDHTVSCNEGLVLFLGPISLRVSQPMGMYQRQKGKKTHAVTQYVCVGGLSFCGGGIHLQSGGCVSSSKCGHGFGGLRSSDMFVQTDLSFVLPRMKELVSGGCPKQNGGPMEDVTALQETCCR